MDDALNRFQDCELILLDTDSPYDVAEFHQLGALVAQAKPHQSYLLASAESRGDVICQSIQEYSPLHATSLILTNLDKAETFGHLLSLTRESQLPISYFTHGPEVPDDIAPATAEKLTNQIIGDRQR